MKTSERPELKEPVDRFAARLREGVKRIPLVDLAELFGAPADVSARIGARGDIVFKEGIFTNDGPELVLAAGRVDLEIPSLMRGECSVDADGFALRFPQAEFTLRAYATVAILRKCFELKEMRATSSQLVLDFGNMLADRCYTF